MCISISIYMDGRDGGGGRRKEEEEGKMKGKGEDKRVGSEVQVFFFAFHFSFMV